MLKGSQPSSILATCSAQLNILDLITQAKLNGTNNEFPYCRLLRSHVTPLGPGCFLVSVRCSAAPLLDFHVPLDFVILQVSYS